MNRQPVYIGPLYRLTNQDKASTEHTPKFRNAYNIDNCIIIKKI